jgi:MFS family permease
MAPPTTMPSAARKLVRRYYTYAGIYTLAASIIWGINTLFLLDAGLSVAEVFIANAAFSVGTVLFEIPTGVVADTIGRRVSFLLSLVVLATSTLGYVWLAQVGGGVVAFSAVSVFMGLGFTFYSGAMEAWLVDGIRSLGFDGGLDRIFARAQIIGGASMLIGTVGGGLLGQIDLAIPFLVRAGLLFVLLALAWAGMRDIGFTPRPVTLATLPAEATAIARTGVTEGWSSRPLRLIMIAGALQNGFFMWAWYAWQPYFLELLGDDAVWVAGVVAALLSVALMAGNALVSVVTRWCGRRTTVLVSAAVVFSLASIGVGLANTFVVALGFLLVVAVAMGITMPVRQTFIHGMVASEQRATIVSFDSLISGVGAVGGQSGLGVLSGREGYSIAYIVGGGVALLAAPTLWFARRMRADADFFEGPQTVDADGCAPQGLPAIASVRAKLSARRR